jgi:protein-disulfide isomerase
VVKPRPRKRDNRKFYMTLGAIAIAGAAVVGYAATRPSAANTVTTVDPALMAGNGQPQGFVMGSPTAPVEIVEYGDFECGWCAQFATVTEPDVRQRLVQTGKARFRFVDFPLQMHRNTMIAHLAAGCAADQGKFWEMHDRIFIGQNEWNAEATSNPKKVIAGYARSLGLDEDVWEDCVDDKKHLPRIQASIAEGNRLRVNSTPTFIINGKMMASSISYDVIKAMVDSAAAAAPATPATAPAATPPPAGDSNRVPKRP